MITLRRAGDRRHQLLRRQEAWLTFHPQDDAAAFSRGFGPLQVLKEGRLPPRAATRQPVQEVEIITYVREGIVLFEDSAGRSGVIRAGEFQRTTAGSGLRISETNASTSHWAHVYQVWLRPTVTGLEPGDAQKRFSKADRHGALCLVASPDGRKGSLLIHQDAYLYSSIFDAGQHVVHELVDGRSAWLHVVAGKVELGDDVLAAGDGAGFTAERAVSITMIEDTEILLVDLVVTGAAGVEGAADVVVPSPAAAMPPSSLMESTCQNDGRGL